MKHLGYFKKIKTYFDKYGNISDIGKRYYITYGTLEIAATYTDENEVCIC